MAQVQLAEVSKIFDHKIYAVRNISFTVQDQEFAVLVGPSGCGKTTVLRIIAGLDEPDSGKIYIGDKMVNGIPPQERDVAMVFQNYALYPHMTVYENMAFGLKMRKFPGTEIKRRVEEAAQILGISDLLNRKPRQLSGGQRQRVALGRAIVRKPKVFLFDEPLSNLDAKLRISMRYELANLHQRLKTTVIYVTHDQTEAMTLGERIIVLKDGEVQQIDTPVNLYAKPKNIFVAGFIGSPPMNFFKGVLRDLGGVTFVSEDNNLHWNLDGIDIPPRFINQAVIAGLRPEDLKLKHPGSISLRIDSVERFGGLTYVYGNFSESTICVALNRGILPRIGETISVDFDRKDLYLFDQATTEAIL